MPTYDEKALLIGAGVVGLGVLAFALTRKQKPKGFQIVGSASDPGIEWSDDCQPSLKSIDFFNTPYNVYDAGKYDGWRPQVIANVTQEAFANAQPLGPGVPAAIDATQLTNDAMRQLGAGRCPSWPIPDDDEYEELRNWWSSLHRDIVAAMRREKEMQDGTQGFNYQITNVLGDI